MTDSSGSAHAEGARASEERHSPEITIVLPMHDEAANAAQILSSVARELDAIAEPQP